MSFFDFTSIEQFKEKCGYEIDGLWYPRVTKIVEIKSKPALYYYYGEAPSYKAAQEATKKSAEEGTLIHETVEKFMVGEKPEIPESIKPAVNAFLNFIEYKNIQVSPEHVEQRICNKEHRFAGTMDALALIDGKFGVLDIKTSQAIYRDYCLQTSAYIGTLTKQHKNLSTRWILRIDQIRNCHQCGATLRPKGGRDKIRKGKSALCPENEHDWSELQGVTELKEFPFWQNDFRAFLGAKSLWEWENEYWLKKAGYLK